ncbi:MAG: sulfatase-like hydrolase/transferase [Vicinamibacterales bacterium]
MTRSSVRAATVARRAIGLGLLTALALVASAACRRATAPRFVGANLVLVSIDTLRSDHLRTYGYRAGVTPSLDQLASEGIVFERAYAQVPLTLPSHTTMFTGLLPGNHGVRDNIGVVVPAARPTLATVLKNGGWKTGAAVSAYVLRRQTGIAQGFDAYDDAVPIDGSAEQIAGVQRDGAAAVEAITTWIDTTGEAPFFAFLHLYEPHTPYSPPERYRHLSPPYDGEVAYADELVGRLVSHLRATGRLDRTIVIVTSDHGEGLGDHGETEHGLLLYREALQVPLIVRLPRAVLAGTRVRGSVGLVDLVATVADLLGVAAPTGDGVSLRASLASGVAPDRPVFAETLYPKWHLGWSDLYAVASGRLRYIRGGDAKGVDVELFDIETDGAEKANLAGKNASDAARLNAWLEPHIGGSTERPGRDTAEVRERLRALGYVGSGAPATAPGPPPHPKDHIASYERFKRALGLRESGRTEAAIDELRALVAENPAMVDGWETLGATLVRAGATDEGLRAFARVLDLAPTKTETHSALARIYALDGRVALAKEHATLAAAGDPAEGYELLAGLALDAGHLDEAAAFARQSLEADDTRVTSRFVLGLAAKQAGQCEAALVDFRRADDERRRQRGAIVRNLHAHMADCLARLGRLDEAAREFRAELEGIPSSPEARMGLSMLLQSSGKADEARKTIEELVSSTPTPTPDTYWAVIRTLRVFGDERTAARWAATARGRFPQDPRFR